MSVESNRMYKPAMIYLNNSFESMDNDFILYTNYFLLSLTIC